jgi:hypothetical protein
MTTGTIGFQGLSVHILMTPNAFPVQSQKGVFILFQIRIRDEIRLMTFPAIDPGMLAGQLESRKLMSESSLIKACHVKITSMMLAVTVSAFPAHHFT